ncbi:MAG: DUF1385 domain-containing protein [Schwartzia sp.]|nr:DUF1385 domain-containing protein [Schwartzia sp. (in: firmicutes)]MBR1885551.1 DUF1385 domain-containing protein [Schwartzia sp. (in: firmicutes)]
MRVAENKNLTVGGQAVLEGVMMRGAGKVATAVRVADGHIETEVRDVDSIADRYPILKKPFLRGVVTLGESLTLGLRSLSYSARMAGEEDEQLSDGELAGTMALAFALAAVLFVAIPTWATRFFHEIFSSPVALNLAEGGLRFAIFLAYLMAISRMEGIYRVFQYHGAEHKTIHAYEGGGPLTVERVQACSRFHPRCGTSFLLIVMLVSIFVFAFLGWPDLLTRVASRVALLPVVAGISYEFIRLAARSKSAVAHLFTLPGLWLQRLTTNPPEDEMVEVAIASLAAVLPEEEKIRMGLPAQAAQDGIETVADEQAAAVVTG